MVFKTELGKIKKLTTLVRDETDFTLEVFLTLHKGDIFKMKAKWRMTDCSLTAYIVSYRIYHRVAHSYGGEMEYQQQYSSSQYLACYLEFTKRIPDTIIQPLSLVFRIADLVLHHNIKPHDQPDFNHRYLLQSVDKENILQILGTDLICTLSSTEDVYIEIRENKCLIYFIRPPKVGDGEILVALLDNLVEINKRL